MNYNYVICYDTETGSRNPYKTQLTQISAIILEPRKLEIVDGAIFNTEIKPIFDDEEAKKLGLDPIEQEALDITKKTREQLEKAPTIDVVWPDFVSFCERYKKQGDKSAWGNPVPAGFNIKNFDRIIVDRMCQKYGPWDDKFNSQKIFHPIHSIDVMDDIFRWTDSVKINDTNSKSLDAVRDWLGMTKEGAHNALNDVIDCAELLKRFMYKYREFFSQIKFAGAMASWKRPELKV